MAAIEAITVRAPIMTIVITITITRTNTNKSRVTMGKPSAGRSGYRPVDAI